MRLLQRIILAVLPTKFGQAVVEESKRWHMRCPEGHTHSVWDAGGLRYKAKGNARTLSHCPRCGRMRWMTFELLP